MDQLQCRRCKKNKPKEGRTACEVCLEKCRVATVKHRKLARERNLCDSCHKNPRKSNGIYCEDCLLRSKAKREGRKTDGCCVICGKPAAINRARCEGCIAYAKNLDLKIRNERRLIGICIKCGKNQVDKPHVKCQMCLSSQALSYHKTTSLFVGQGLCAGCGNTPLPENRFCEICYLKKIAGKRAGGSKQWMLIKEIYERQSGTCPYTGQKLFLGKNADLDHIVPKSDGGSSEVGNLQWILNKVNTMKWNNTEEEFLLLVKTIYEYRQLDKMQF